MLGATTETVKGSSDLDPEKKKSITTSEHSPGKFWSFLSKRNLLELERLLSKASAEDAKTLMNSVSMYGNTPLHIGITNFLPSVILQLFITKGANVDAQNLNGESPLHKAVKAKNICFQHITLLLDAGANIHLRDKNGYSAFDIVNFELAEYLSKQQANEKKILPNRLYNLCIKMKIDVSKYGKGFNNQQWQSTWKNIKESNQSVFVNHDGTLRPPLDTLLRRAQEQIADTINSSGSLAVSKTSTQIVSNTTRVWKLKTNNTIKSNVKIYLPNKYKISELREILTKISEEEIKKFVHYTTTFGNTPLHAATSGNFSLPIIRQILDAGANVNAQNLSGESPLHKAVKSKSIHFQHVKSLLNAGASMDLPDNNGDSPSGIIDFEVAQYTSKQQTNGKKTLPSTLYDVCAVMGKDVSQYQREANSDNWTPVWRTVKGSNKRKISDVAGTVSSQRSSKNANSKRFFLLYRSNISEIRKMLANMSPKEIKSFMRCTNKNGNTPLHVATLRSRPLDLVRLFLNSGADINAQNLRGESPLYMAVTSKTISFARIQLLLENGADIHLKDKNGDSVFDIIKLEADKYLASQQTGTKKTLPSLLYNLCIELKIDVSQYKIENNRYNWVPSWRKTDKGSWQDSGVGNSLNASTTQSQQPTVQPMPLHTPTSSDDALASVPPMGMSHQIQNRHSTQVPIVDGHDRSINMDPPEMAASYASPNFHTGMTAISSHPPQHYHYSGASSVYPRMLAAYLPYHYSSRNERGLSSTGYRREVPTSSIHAATTSTTIQRAQRVASSMPERHLRTVRQSPHQGATALPMPQTYESEDRSRTANAAAANLLDARDRANTLFGAGRK